MLHCGEYIDARAEGAFGLILESNGKKFGTYSKHVVWGELANPPSSTKILYQGEVISIWKKGDRLFTNNCDFVCAELMPNVVGCNVADTNIDGISSQCEAYGDKKNCAAFAFSGIDLPLEGMNVELSTPQSLARGVITKVVSGSQTIAGQRFAVLIECNEVDSPQHGDSGAIWYEPDSRKAIAYHVRQFAENSRAFVGGSVASAMKALVISDWVLF